MTNDEPSGDGPNDPAATPAADKKTASVHDTFFYKIFSDPQLAAAELKAIMSPELSAEIEWASLQTVPMRFVDGNLGNHFADILLRAKLRGEDLYLHLLFEHSSGPKALELLQTLRYQVRIWEKEAGELIKKEGGRIRRLSPIITVILHHSETGWRGRMRFRDYFGLDDDLAAILGPYLVDFGIVLDDVSKVDTEALLMRPVPAEVQIALFALRYGRSGRRMLDELPKIGPTVGQLMGHEYGRIVMGLFFVYIRRVSKVPEAEIQMALQDYVEFLPDPEMAAVWEQWEAGEREGLRKGKLEGERKGQRTLLTRLLGQRFGQLPPRALERLDAASLDDLEAMSLRILTAATLDEVLGCQRDSKD